MTGEMVIDRGALKRAWTGALRSGEYRQGVGALKSGPFRCSLGVLHELAPLLKTHGATLSKDGFPFSYKKERPNDRYPELGLGCIGHPIDACVRLNDGMPGEISGLSFAEIADWIEGNLE